MTGHTKTTQVILSLHLYFPCYTSADYTMRMLGTALMVKNTMQGLCSLCMPCLACTLPFLYLVFVVFALLSLHPSSFLENVLYTCTCIIKNYRSSCLQSEYSNLYKPSVVNVHRCHMSRSYHNTYYSRDTLHIPHIPSHLREQETYIKAQCRSDMRLL